MLKTILMYLTDYLFKPVNLVILDKEGRLHETAMYVKVEQSSLIRGGG